MFTLAVPLWELILRGVVVYLFLIVLLRLTGKRQVGQLSPFDLVLLLVLSNAVQNSMNAGDNSLFGRARLGDHTRRRQLARQSRYVSQQAAGGGRRGASRSSHPQRQT